MNPLSSYLLIFTLICALINHTQSYSSNNDQQLTYPYPDYSPDGYSYPDPNSNPFLYPIPSSRYKYHHFTLTNGYCNPDNFTQPCYLINNQFPGPPIFVNQFDFLQVTVVNQLNVSTAIHFHGILQSHTVASDGVAFVTQDPILPGQTYIYQMDIEGQTGTYMYHGHVDLDLIWLHGPLIIRDNPEYCAALGPPYFYDIGHEHIFQLESISHPPSSLVASLAINGFSYGIWPNSTNSSSTSYSNQYQSPGYEVVSVTPGKTYRFRIINIATSAFLRFQIENHTLLVIEADGIIIEPVVTPYLEINTGQRYSVLVTMNNTINNYWISSILMSGSNIRGPSNGKAILHYEGASDPTPLKTQLFLETTPGLEPTLHGWILSEIRPNLNHIGNVVYPFPEKSNRTIFVDIQLKRINGSLKFLTNGHVYKEPNITYLTRVMQGQDISVGDTHVFKIMKGDVVDVVIQNLVDQFGGCGEHPIHFHGHSFWVVALGNDTLDMETQLPGVLAEAEKKGSWREFRDVYTLFPGKMPVSKVTGDGCGWGIVRFIADNPGIWYVHCHITIHMVFGKLFALYEVEPANERLINE